MLVLAGAKAMAFDLAERKPISLGKDLSRLVDGRTAFVDCNKLVFECDWDAKAGTSRDTFKCARQPFRTDCR